MQLRPKQRKGEDERELTPVPLSGPLAFSGPMGASSFTLILTIELGIACYTFWH